MDEKQTILTSIAAAIACNCIPCYEHYWMKAKRAGISNDEVLEAVAIGEKVKSGAAMSIKGTVNGILSGEIDEKELCQNTPCVCKQ